jgi:hypothetical protein
MSRHVCRQNNPDHPFPKSTLVIFAELTHEIILFRVQNCQALSRVVIFLDTYIVIPERSIAENANMITIIETIVPKVVANCCYNNS